MLFTRMKQEPQESMEPSEHSPQAGFNQAPKRPIKPEEQALIDEFAELSSKYGEQFPNIIEYVQKGMWISQAQAINSILVDQNNSALPTEQLVQLYVHIVFAVCFQRVITLRDQNPPSPIG